MNARTKQIVIVTVFAAIAVLWLGGNQARLAKKYGDLQDELVAVKRDSERRFSGDGGSRLRGESEDPGSGSALSALPSDLDEVATLRKKLKEMDKEVAEMRDTIAQFQQGAATRRSLGTALGGGLIQNLVLDGNGQPLAGRSWGQEQVLGEPNTKRLGDIPTAWAPKQQDAGEEWLHIDFDKAVALSEINVHETHNPGAISKVAAVLPDGSEEVIWEGSFENEIATGVIERAFQVDGDITADSVKIYMDTTRVSGWNEIDAVEIVGADNSRQWASDARASSTYAE